MGSGLRIQGRVTEEQFVFYKDLKAQAEKEMKLPAGTLGDGQFLIKVLEEYAENHKDAK